MKRLLLAALAAVVLAGSALPASAQTTPEPLSDSDIAAVEGVLQAWCDAALDNDLERFAEPYSEHAVEIFQTGRSNVSRANIIDRVQPWFYNGAFTQCENRVLSIEGAGDLALALISNTQQWKDASNGTVTDYAFNFGVVLKEEADGMWRILALHWADVE